VTIPVKPAMPPESKRINLASIGHMPR